MTTTRELTKLERAIGDVKAGFGQPTDVLTALAASDLVVPSITSDIKDMSDVQPLVFDTPGGPMLAIFTHPDLIGEYSEKARFAIQVPGYAVLKSIGTGTGLVVNPGRPSGFELPASGVADLKAGLGL